MFTGTSLVVHRLRLRPSAAGGESSTPGLGAKLPQVWWPENQNIGQTQYCHKFNKDLKNGSRRTFPGGTVDENLPGQFRGSIPGPERSHVPWSN